MSDDIRTRIIAALLSEDNVVLSRSAAQVLADAVIRELGLEPETRIGPGEPGEGLSGYIRYVTGWRVDD